MLLPKISYIISSFLVGIISCTDDMGCGNIVTDVSVPVIISCDDSVIKLTTIKSLI